MVSVQVVVAGRVREALILRMNRLWLVPSVVCLPIRRLVITRIPRLDRDWFVTQVLEKALLVSGAHIFLAHVVDMLEPLDPRNSRVHTRHEILEVYFGALIELNVLDEIRQSDEMLPAAWAEEILLLGMKLKIGLSLAFTMHENKMIDKASSYLSAVFAQTGQSVKVQVTDIAPEMHIRRNSCLTLFLKLLHLMVSHGVYVEELCAAKLAGYESTLADIALTLFECVETHSGGCIVSVWWFSRIRWG